MWPWSTIRRLRSELAEALNRGDRWQDEHRALAQRWGTLNESYETAQEMLRSEGSARRDAQQQLAESEAREARLKSKLADAYVRDPKTGRLGKMPPILSLIGQSTGEVGH